eukprot:12350091-Karenia_brevis.AAC.1
MDIDKWKDKRCRCPPLVCPCWKLVRTLGLQHCSPLFLQAIAYNAHVGIMYKGIYSLWPGNILKSS